MDALTRGRGELAHGSLGALLLPAGPVPAIFEHGMAYQAAGEAARHD
jgi:hypothetical protein